jgi:hypothetical protein
VDKHSDVQNRLTEHGHNTVKCISFLVKLEQEHLVNKEGYEKEDESYNVEDRHSC